MGCQSDFEHFLRTIYFVQLSDSLPSLLVCEIINKSVSMFPNQMEEPESQAFLAMSHAMCEVTEEAPASVYWLTKALYNLQISFSEHIPFMVCGLFSGGKKNLSSCTYVIGASLERFDLSEGILTTGATSQCSNF